MNLFRLALQTNEKAFSNFELSFFSLTLVRFSPDTLRVILEVLKFHLCMDCREVGFR